MKEFEVDLFWLSSGLEPRLLAFFGSRFPSMVVDPTTISGSSKEAKQGELWQERISFPISSMGLKVWYRPWSSEKQNFTVEDPLCGCSMGFEVILNLTRELSCENGLFASLFSSVSDSKCSTTKWLLTVEELNDVIVSWLSFWSGIRIIFHQKSCYDVIKNMEQLSSSI